MAQCIEVKKCGGDDPKIDKYRLSGPQVEPGASYWNRCPRPCPVSYKELVSVTDDINSRNYFPEYPTDPAVVQDELAELQELERLRYDPTAIASTIPGRERCPLSIFLQLRPVPLGANVNFARGDGFPVIFNGAELARYFENETPGLAHRQALNYLIRETNWSPPRQALVWEALDVAIYSALNAAWYYKWLSPRPNTSFRQRPFEFALDNDCPLNVLFDRPVNGLGSDSVDDLVAYPALAVERNGRRPDFFPPVPGFINQSPGTPRHPAYPSGHSTYSGAASELLSFFFPDYRADFDRLADNIGMARLWAGVHWRSDHVAGMKLGRTVACLVIQQLLSTNIPLVPAPPQCDQTPPDPAWLEQEAEVFERNCGVPQGGPIPGVRCRGSIGCFRTRPIFLADGTIDTSAEESKSDVAASDGQPSGQGSSTVGA